MSDEFNEEEKNLNSEEVTQGSENANDTETQESKDTTSETESSQYRMSFSGEGRKLSDDISNASEGQRNSYNQYEEPVRYQMPEPDNNPGGGKKNSNMGPIWGILAAALVLALIIGGLLAAVKLTGSDKDVAKPEETTVALTKESTSSDEDDEKQTEAKEDETEKSTENAALNVTLTASENVESTGTVTATLLDVSPIVEEVMPTVVAVTNTTVYKSSSNGFGLWGWMGGIPSDDYTNSGAGSGVIIAQNEEYIMIATNAHVVVPQDYSNYGLTPENSEYAITFCDDSSVAAMLKGYDEEKDLAVLLVKKSEMEKETLDTIKIATIGDSDKLKVGNGVIVIGNAMAIGQSVTVGYISALNREYKIDGETRTLIQTDAAINPGNSGGGLFDMYGHLIGINEAKIASTSIEGICFAIPISSAESILEDIMNKETVVREKVTDEDKMSYLGISSEKQYSEAYEGQGAFVGGIIEDGPAANAGIMEYDIITAIDGQEVRSWSELLDELAYHEGGETVDVEYYTLEMNGKRREYVKRETKVTLGFKKDYVKSEQ